MVTRVVVMGGSYNPPTIAHLQLMQAAVDAVHAQRGVFVPTADGYVARKLKRQKCLQDLLSNAIRIEMLESFCAKDSRLTVSRVQLKQPERVNDYAMLEDVQAEYPDAELYFVLGSDKLYILPRWSCCDSILDKFRILVARRGEDDLENIKAIRPYLAQRWDRFVGFDVPEEISRISSSAFRERLRQMDGSACELVTPEVWQIMKENGKIPWNSIADFHEEQYSFLSNFYDAPVMYDGLTFKNAEAAFQAQKCMTAEEKAKFTEYSPGKSKGIGRRVQLRPDWERVKYGIMEGVVRAKFTQRQDLAARLLATGDKVLVEGNRWGDTCWGVDVRTGQGENHLGKILMKVREELRAHAADGETNA